MKAKLLASLTALALGAVPALALADTGQGTPPTNTGTSHMPTNPGSQGKTHKPSTPGPNASLPAKAKAYGKRCLDLDASKKHSDAMPGTKGTPFSQCVTAMAKLATGKTNSPKAACVALSKAHVKGHKGTAFSECVTAGEKLLKSKSNS
jgi:hypothetical protein